MRHIPIHLPLALSALAMSGLSAFAVRLDAQEKLVRASTATTGIVYENWLLPTAVGVTTSSGSVLVTGASQLTVPVAVVVPLFPGWTVDAYAAYVRGRVRLENPDGTPRAGYDLTGMSDAKLRVIGKLRGEAMLFTMGVTAPTGRTELSPEQLGALSVVSSPALRFRSPVLGTGAGATAGLILAHPVGPVGMALGASYEVRGTYAPAEAIQAGAPTTDLRPGNGVHLSVAADVTAGALRHVVSVAADAYQSGELREPAGTVERSTLTLGPTITGSYELDATMGAVESAVFVLVRHRAQYKLGGETVAGSDRTELDGGAHLFRAVSPTLGLRLVIEGRMHSVGESATGDGTSADSSSASFATAGALIGGGTVGVRVGGVRSGWALEPFARAQAGRLDFGSVRRSVRAVSGGLTLSATF